MKHAAASILWDLVVGIAQAIGLGLFLGVIAVAATLPYWIAH